LRDFAVPMSTNLSCSTTSPKPRASRSFTSASRQFAQGAREMALAQSVESSNRIEGVTVAPDRLRPLCQQGYEVGRYISLERLVEEAKTAVDLVVAWNSNDVEDIAGDFRTVLGAAGFGGAPLTVGISNRQKQKHSHKFLYTTGSNQQTFTAISECRNCLPPFLTHA
jgi:hypothetical protein